MTDFPKLPPNYSSKTVPYKTTPAGHTLNLSIAYPSSLSSSSSSADHLNILFYIHGGFLFTGNRFAFFPYWLFNAATTRNCVFVTANYRLIPESTGRESVEDVVDAYQWTVESLPSQIFSGGSGSGSGSNSNKEIRSVVIAGSSAGGYLALATASNEKVLDGTRPADGLLLVYGMLDPGDEWYTSSKGNTIFNIPREAFDCPSIVAGSPHAGGDGKKEKRQGEKEVSDDAIVGDPSKNPRFPLIQAVHVQGVFCDYLTGIDGLGQKIKEQGVQQAVVEATETTGTGDDKNNKNNNNNKALFPLDFARLAELPRTFLLHGKNDSGVPWVLSRTAAERMEKVGVQVERNFPEDAEHGFDTSCGDVDVEKMTEVGKDVVAITPAFEGLRRAVEWYDEMLWHCWM